MKLNRGTCYALYGLRYLAAHPDKGFVQASEIAEHWKIPEYHLSKLLQTLAKRNVVLSKRGAGGGFALAKPARQISLLDVYEALEGPTDINNCLIHPEKASPCSACSIVGPLQQAHLKIRQVLKEVTLDKLAEKPC
jgi:Rrf2 family protein